MDCKAQEPVSTSYYWDLLNTPRMPYNGIHPTHNEMEMKVLTFSSMPKDTDTAKDMLFMDTELETYVLAYEPGLRTFYLDMRSLLSLTCLFDSSV